MQGDFRQPHPQPRAPNDIHNAGYGGLRGNGNRCGSPCVYVLMTEKMTSVAASEIVESFEGFFHRASKPLFRAVALAVRDVDLAEDAVNEAMVRAYERWERVAGLESPEGWVYRVAVNWATSRLRRRKFLSTSSVPDLASDTQHVADPKVFAAIRGLPLRHREVIVARFLLDMSETEMAAALGVANGTIKSRLSRALRSLRKELS